MGPNEQVIENLIETHSFGSQETSLKQTSNIADDNFSTFQGPNLKNQTITESINTSVEEAIVTTFPDIDNDLKPTKNEVNSSKDVNNGNTLAQDDNSDALNEDNQYSMTTNNNPDTKTDTIQDISITTIDEEQVNKKNVTEDKYMTTEYKTSQQASQDLYVSPVNTEGPATPTKNQVTTKAAELVSTGNPEIDNNLASDSYVSKTFDITTHQWYNGIDKEQTETNDYSNEQNRNTTTLSSKSTELSETLSTTNLKTKDYSNEKNQDATSLSTKSTELSETLTTTTLRTNDYSNEQIQDGTSLSTKSTEISETLTTTTLKTKDYSNEQNQDATSLSTNSTGLSETLTTTTMKPKNYSNEQNQDATSLLTKSTELSETLMTTTLKSLHSEKQESTKITLKEKITEKTTSGGENIKTLTIDNDAKPSAIDQTPPQTTTCECPTTSTSSSTTQVTTPGILTTSGLCICPNSIDSSKEEETATNMPETKGRRRRRKEYEEMDLYVDKFDQKIMKKMPFLKFY